MGETTGIAWTDHTFNIAWGCHKVSPGCDHCYAETFSKRTGHAIWGPPKDTARRTFGAKHWAEPLRWNAAAAKAGVRRRVFCSSMCDVFEAHPTIDAERAKLWPLIRATPHLDWQLLTKRPERIARCLPEDWCDDGYGYPNVWLGTSIESQDYVKRAWVLADVVARVRFISFEPLLTAIEMPTRLGESVWSVIDWAIIGGESGPGHREMPLFGATDLIHTLRNERVAVFVKQDSGPRPGHQGRIPDEYWIQEMP